MVYLRIVLLQCNPLYSMLLAPYVYRETGCETDREAVGCGGVRRFQRFRSVRHLVHFQICPAETKWGGHAEMRAIARTWPV